MGRHDMMEESDNRKLELCVNAIHCKRRLNTWQTLKQKLYEIGKNELLAKPIDRMEKNCMENQREFWR